jgi:hypothetical protein
MTGKAFMGKGTKPERKPDAGNSHVRFDEWDVETELTSRRATS